MLTFILMILKEWLKLLIIGSIMLFAAKIVFEPVLEVLYEIFKKIDEKD